MAGMYRDKKRFAGTALLMSAVLCLASPAGLAKPSSSPVEASAQCSDDRRSAEEWIRWALETAAFCSRESASSAATHRDCLADARQQLSALASDYARVYQTEMKTLHPNHPIIRNLVRKVEENAAAAAAIIDQHQQTGSVKTPVQLVCAKP